MTTLIADSGSTKTDWALVDDAGQILFTGKTQGINPFHLSDDDIWKILAEELTLPEVPARVFFYGSGVTESMKPRMEHLLFQQFPQAEVHAESEYVGDFMGAFSNASSGAGLAIGSMLALVFTFIYFWLRGSIGFEKSFESVPNGFIQMISPILILTFAWTLCGLTRYGMNSADFVVNAMSGAGDLAKFLPAVIFIIGAAIGFATGTSWGTIGIMAPIVVQVFDYNTQPILCTIGLAAACSGGVMGDHCSPISDTTIMASAGAHCFHLNHVFTQLPYALTVSGVTFVSFILAGLIQNVVICLVIACILMVATLLVIRAIVAKKHAGIFQEMAEANKAMAK